MLCVSVSSRLTVAYAEEIDAVIPSEEIIQQETVPQETIPYEEEIIPAIWDPQPDEVND